MSEEEEEKHYNLIVDTSKIETKLDEIKGIMESKQLEKTEGKGEVVTKETHHKKIVESLHGGSIREQWEAPVALPTAPTARIATFVIRSEAVLDGKPGDIVNLLRTQ